MAALTDCLWTVTATAGTMDTRALVAGLGPVTSTGELVAASAGAGIVLGGLAAGVVGMALGWDHGLRERTVVNCGYQGGVLMVVAMLAEAIIP
jgi:hypothetical protein